MLGDEGYDGFELLGALMRAWASTIGVVLVDMMRRGKGENEHADGQEIDQVDPKMLRSHVTRLEDSDTMLAFGYVARAAAKSGREFRMQAEIVNALVPEGSRPTKDEVDDERARVRTDIKRRMDALEIFGMVKREHLSPVAVQLSLTAQGSEYLKIFNMKVAEEIGKLKGEGR